MADIQNFHGNPFVGTIVNIVLYLIFTVTGSGLALAMTILSAAIVALANLPRAIENAKQYLKKLKKKV